MTRGGPAALLAGTLALAACGGADRADIGNAAAGAASVALPPAGAAPATADAIRIDQAADETDDAVAAAQTDPAFVTRAWFAGRWTDSGDCADAGTFDANGTYRLADGTRGMWNVRDGTLVVQNATGRTEAALRKLDERTVEVRNPDGAVGRSRRC